MTITTIGWNKEEYALLTKILNEEKVDNKSAFFKQRILHKRKGQVVYESSELDRALLAHLVDRVIDDYRNKRDIIADLLELKEGLKKKTRS